MNKKALELFFSTILFINVNSKNDEIIFWFSIVRSGDGLL